MPLESCRDEILAQLDRILASKDFCQAPSLSKLLRFVVEQTLAGNGAGLKEVTLGVEVFGLSTDDGTVKTSVVRVNAYRVRKRLAAYYETVGNEDPWIITLLDEGYTPRIVARAPRPAAESVPDPPRWKSPARSRWKTGATVCAAALLVMTASLVAWSYASRTPVVTSFTQLTNTGHMKDGPLLSDGSHRYFEDRIEGVPVPVSMPIGGGTVTRLEIPSIQSPMLLDYQRNGHRFLVSDNALSREAALWEWTPGALPRPLKAGDLDRWVPDSLLKQVSAGKLQMAARKRRALGRTLPVPGIAEFPRWLPGRQLLRFTVGDPPGERYSLWEMHAPHATPEPIRDYPKNARFGTWSADGKLFVFQADRNNADGGDDIWAVNEEGPAFLRKLLKPIRLTDGPLDFGYPLPNADGTAIFTIGTVQRMDIVRYNAASGAYQPFLGGLGGLEPDFSRDKSWIAYSSHPERTLWKVRADGTQDRQLTFAPLMATQPHWSPDGSRIAFMGQYPGRPWRIYVVSSNGGAPNEVTNYPVEQGVPTWSSDGTRLVFGERRVAGPNPEMELHVVDLASKRVVSVPESHGMWSARWSPDGRWIAATSVDSRRLLLFDCRTQMWRPLASFRILGDPAWAADSRNVYFYAEGRWNAPEAPVTQRAIYRMSVRDKVPKLLVDLSKVEPREFPWYGVAPDGTPLAARRRTLQDVYKLTIRW